MHRIGATSQNGPRRNSGPVFVSSVLKCIHCIAEYGVSARTEMPIAFRTIARLNSAPLGIVRTTEADSVVIHTDTFGLLQWCALARPTRLELKVSSNTMAPLGSDEFAPEIPRCSVPVGIAVVMAQNNRIVYMSKPHRRG
jgi:hypothetical protein